MVIIRDGYQRFEGEFALIATVPEDVLGGGGNGDDNNLNNTLDGTYNFIQNIYLFPVGATAPSYNFYVEYDNERVPGATIYLEQDTNNNIETSLTSANMLAATSGLIPVLTATTDDTGLATFAGSSLVLGGRYNVTVLPVVYEGVQLAMNTGEVINFIGMENGGGEDGNITRMIAMADLEPNDQSDGLYIIYASNHDPQDITGIDPDVAGVLTVVFNRPVAMPNANDCTATLIGATDAVLTDPGNPDSVDTDVSDDGYTLILTPHWDTEPDETDVNMDILYAGCTITLMDDDLHNEMLLFGNVDIEYIDTNVPLNATVQITGEQE
jgi:hypothetical protein